MNAGKFTKISDQAKQIAKDIQKMQYLSRKSADMIISERARGKAREEANHLGSHIEKQMHELHCLCVEAGIAEWDQSRYGEKIHKVNAWTEHKVMYRQPVI